MSARIEIQELGNSARERKITDAVLALDAATHGERGNEIDYQHVNTFDDPKAPVTSRHGDDRLKEA